MDSPQTPPVVATLSLEGRASGVVCAANATKGGAAEPARRGSWAQPLGRRCAIGLSLLSGSIAVSALLPDGMVLGAAHTDLINQFAAWRAFAAESIRAGDFPLWNPHTYAGQPFAAGFQSALFYPLNVLFLVLPLALALNATVLLHLGVLGWGVAYWARTRGVGVFAATLAGLLVATSGPVIPHVYAGHLSNLCTMAWMPWAFAGLEKAWTRGAASGLLLAAAAFALQILAGQVQYVFFGGVAAAAMAVLASVGSPRSRRALPVLLAAVLGALVLAAVQLMPSFGAAEETVRASRLEYAFASLFALPPENGLTAVAPSAFGAMQGDVPYWGRCYPWEMSLFVGVGAMLLVGVALAHENGWRVFWREVLLIGLLLALALGRHLPLHAWLYEHVPGFDRFRGMSKFTFPAVLVFGLLVAAGLDRVGQGLRSSRAFALIAAGLGLAFLAAGALLVAEPERGIPWFHGLRAASENDFPAAWYAPAGLPARAVTGLGQSVAMAGLTAAVLGAALLMARRWPWARWAVAVVVPLEMAAFGWSNLTTSSLAFASSPAAQQVIAAHPGDYRVINTARPNNGFLLGKPDVWGNDPVLLQRYAEFIAFTQGRDPDTASQNQTFARLHPLYALLRCRFGFVPTDEGLNVATLEHPLPRAYLVGDYAIEADRDRRLAAMVAEGFDPKRTVVLETEPEIRPAPHPVGRVEILAESSDAMTLSVETASAAILVITDAFSRGWQVRGAGSPAQPDYALLPANHVIRAIPLAAGSHRLELSYEPPGLRVGALVSTLGWLALGATAVALHWRSARQPSVAGGRVA